jgi:hypothetical protein
MNDLLSIQYTAGGEDLGTVHFETSCNEVAQRRFDRAMITEWENLEKAQAFFTSKAWTDLGPDRDKALKTVRRYAVEVRN